MTWGVEGGKGTFSNRLSGRLVESHEHLTASRPVKTPSTREAHTVATNHHSEGSVNDQAFKVETHGIDFIPESERWATPRNIGAMWAGSAINVEYFVYGALLMGFGFSFLTALSIILIGNLSYLLLGVASLQGQETGTTAFAISRAPFGARGSRITAFFNWITQLGFETEGLILIVGAFIVLTQYAGWHINSTEKVIAIIVATSIQAIMPYLGHATMVKVLRALIIPFAVIFAIFAFIESSHSNTGSVFVFAHGWEPYTAGLAFTIALSGLGWTECGNDYTRYLPREAKKSAVVGWIFLGTALPEIVMMTLGALAFSFLGNSATWNSANPFEALYHQKHMPSAFVVVFLIFAIVQLFGINSLDLYSSGVSVQAMGLKLKRYQAVLMDSVIAGALTIWATFGSTFSIYMKDFVGVIIVWISPWFGVFIMDWVLRKYRYSAEDLQVEGSESRYWGTNGFNWNGIVAFGAGVVASAIGFSKAPPPVNFPLHWMTPFSNHFGSFYCDGSAKANCGPAGWFGGADLSIFFGILSAGLIYFVLNFANRFVENQTNRVTSKSTPVANIITSGIGTSIAGFFLAFESIRYINPASVSVGFGIATFVLGLILGLLGLSTALHRSDRFRDASFGIGLLLLVWAVILNGYFSSRNDNFDSLPALVVAASLICIIARSFLPRSPQVDVK